MTRVAGLDLSLTSTGWAITDDGSVTTGRITSKPPALAATRSLTWYRSSLDRIGALMLAVGDLTVGCDLVVVEGPSLHAKGNATDRMFGLWWLVLCALDQRGRVYAVVTPSAVKKYMTGAGNAGKDAVLAAVIKRLPGDVTGNDEADALALAAMGADYLGAPIAAMPAAHRAVLATVEWPPVRKEVTARWPR